MCCLVWSVPSVVLCVGWMVCHSSSGEGVPWSLSVGWWPLDVWPVSVDWWPVVSTLDTLPAVSLCRGQSVGCVACSQYPRHSASGEGVAVVVSDCEPVAAGMCCLSVVSSLGAVSRSDGVPVRVCRGVCVDCLPVACGLVALDTLPAVRVSDGLPVGLVAVVSTLDTLPACEGVGW